ncbi:hypothetical protein [uncultured Polaribacter sp.]|uniref:hypothetical protein n=1 Tax=uncultured Polaribacter sp. TaxID=174711 RepID=UPI0026251866|nr:hypothetical protein [uncultured Polaribacter sp.]
MTRENDTIFGIYRYKGIIDLNGKIKEVHPKTIKEFRRKNRVYKLVENPNSYENFTTNDSLVFYNITLSNGFWNDKIALYEHKLKKEKRKDYVINKENDTLYGQIIRSFYLQYKIIDSKNETSINSRLIKEFRKDGYKYYYKKKRKINNSDRRYGYLKLMIDGPVKLYGYSMHMESGIVGVRSEKGEKYKDYEIPNYEMEYFIERDGVLNYVLPTRFYQIIKRVLPENKSLLEIIRSRRLKYYDIYFVINYFNEKLENY